MKRLDSWISESAHQWRVPRRAAIWTFYAPLVGALLVLGARLDKDLYRLLLGEDGPVEWAQFALFAFSAAAAAGVALRLRQASQQPNALLFALAAAALFFIAGEEISWGQRVFGFATPAKLAAVNKQNEISLHNIGETLSVINFAMMLIGAWGAMAWLGDRRLGLGRALGDLQRLVIVPFFLASPFAVVFAYKLIRSTVWQQSAFTITKYGEWAELCLAFGLCAFTLLNYRRLGEELSVARATRRPAARPTSWEEARR